MADCSYELPEVASVYWRPRATDRALRRTGWVWTLSTAAHVVPFVGAAIVLLVVSLPTIPVALGALAHAWAIPELYAARGANVLRPKPAAGDGPERTALGLLGDLIDTAPRELLARTGYVVERGAFGTWIVGEAGAVLLRSGGRRAYCYCVKATGDGLPSSDRIAHLLLALRSDEAGFITVANLAFSGARWRLARRVRPAAREALGYAAALEPRPSGPRPAPVLASEPKAA
jgi:hypothetical protein